MKKTKIVIPALAVLLLSTAASVSGTVAWFSMNNSVKVDGMTVKTKVSSNLLIAETNLEENYSDAIEQQREGYLEPASTIDGKNYFYTVNAKGDGSAKSNNFLQYSEATTALGTVAAGKTGKTHYDNQFNTKYGFTSYDAANNTGDVAFAYMDYSFYIKATSAAADQVLYMSKCNLTYKNAGGTAYEALQAKDYAWRVALLAVPTSANTAADDSGLVLKSILGLEKSLNQNQVSPVDTTDFTPGTTSVSSYYLDPQGKSQASGNYTSGTKYYNAPAAQAQAVNSATTKANIGAAQSAAAQAATDIDAGVTSYTRIVVRLWLEGEDISCTSTTYADLTRDWQLTLEFQLGNADDGAAQNPVATGAKVITSNPALDAEE